VDEEVRRLLRLVAEDDTLPPSAVSDAELTGKCQAARRPSRRARSWRTGTAALRTAITAVRAARQRILSQGAGRSGQR